MFNHIYLDIMNFKYYLMNNLPEVMYKLDLFLIKNLDNPSFEQKILGGDS